MLRYLYYNVSSYCKSYIYPIRIFQSISYHIKKWYILFSLGTQQAIPSRFVQAHFDVSATSESHNNAFYRTQLHHLAIYHCSSINIP